MPTLCKTVYSAAKSCPLRVPRCAQLAARDFLCVVSDLYSPEAALLLLGLPSTLNDQDRLIIMQDFERSRQHLLTAVILTLAHWQEAPFTEYGVVHEHSEEACARYKKALDSAHQHPLLVELRSPEFRDDRLYFEHCEGALLCSRVRATRPVCEAPSPSSD